MGDWGGQLGGFELRFKLGEGNRKQQFKRQQLELVMEQWIGSNGERSLSRPVYFHPAYLTYMHSISYEMLDWMNHKLESRLPGEIATTSDMQMIPS